MDLVAHKILNSDKEISSMIRDYISKYYGDIPRCRGVRILKVEEPLKEGDHVNYDINDVLNSPIDDSYYIEQNAMFNKYVGQDVIYIHTRCGDCGMGYDNEDSNYVSCGARDWEKQYQDLFLDHVTDGFDQTYCTHYFKAVINDEYNAIIKYIEDIINNEGE